MTGLVTGAGGFIGQRFSEPGDRCLVRRPTGMANEVPGDLLDPPSLTQACAGVETVYHCAGLSDAMAGDEEALWRVNVVGTRNLLAAAAAAGVRRFVFLSSVKAMAEPGTACVDEDHPGAPTTPYGRAKRAAEDAVLEAGERHGLHVVNLRLAMVYGRGSRGNLARMARAIQAGWWPRLPDTGQRRSVVHVQDVVDAMRLVAQHPQARGRTYIVADPQPYTVHEMDELIRATLGCAQRWAPTLPAWALQRAARLHPRLDARVQRLLGPACYSPARIERELGFRARIGLAEGLREMLG